jgi:hypothetical protein
MKVRKKVLISALFCFLYSSFCAAYVYQLSVLKKNDAEVNGRSQVVICFGDYHDRTSSHNAQQRNSLESIIKNHKNCKLIVEDLSSINNNGRNTCCNFIISSEGGILGKLADVMRASSVAVDNVEYRYCRVAAFGPLLKNKSSDPFSFLSTSTIGFDVLLTEILDEISHIKTYDDGFFLNTLYKKTTQHITQECNVWKSYIQHYKNVAEYCKKIGEKNSSELEKMCVFDSALIDMKILHSIINSPDKSIIFVVAGGSHIEKIETLLQKLGYTLSFTSSRDAATATLLKELEMTNNETNAGKKTPPAIDLDIVNTLVF